MYTYQQRTHIQVSGLRCLFVYKPQNLKTVLFVADLSEKQNYLIV